MSTPLALASAAYPEPPATLGYRFPAEWEPHAGTWMGWPQRPDNWRNHAVHVQRAFVAVATAIAQFEQVTVCANAEQVGGVCPAPCYTSSCTLCLQDCKARQACVPHPTAALLRCHHAQVATARAALPGQVEVVCVAQDDSWFRDTGPTVGHAACSFTAAVLLPCAAALLLFV